MNKLTKILLLACLLLSLPYAADAQTPRSSAVRRAYQKHLGLKKTPGDPGECQYDHTIPLKYGGKDEVGNFELICGPVLKAKEKAERNPQAWEIWAQECLPH